MSIAAETRSPGTADVAAALVAAAEKLRVPLALVFTAALFALLHPYVGIIGDSTIYIGRAIADLDPGGVGRDIAFVNDGQSRFSLFSQVAPPLVAALGPSRAAVLIAAAGSLAFFAGAFALARALATGRTAFAIIIAVAVLPVHYGNPYTFAFAETAALPRPFAEGAVLAALAALIAGRWGMAAVALGLALLVHPIMALAGVGAAVVLVAWRRSARATAVLIAAFIAAAAAAPLLGWSGVPLFDRLVVRMDPAWFDMLITRSPHLFPTHWVANALCPAMAQITTLLVAAADGGPRRRRVLVAVAIAALAQLAAAAVLGDMLHLLLAVQVQGWRAMWLVAVTGGCCLPLVWVELWPRGPAARVVLALLGLAWFFDPDPFVTLIICATALVLRFTALGAGISARGAALALIAALGLDVLWSLEPIAGYVAFLHNRPPYAPLSLVDPIRNNLHTLPLCVVLALWLPWRPRSKPLLGVGALAALTTLTVAAAASTWDTRTPYRRFVETQAEPAGFSALAAGRNPEVLWIGALGEPWYMLRRPQYASPQQAVGIVFSRSLAMDWRRRADAVISLGLAPEGLHRPRARMADTDRLILTAGKLATYCQRDDAAGVVVIPLRDDLSVPIVPGAITWRPPSTGYVIDRYERDEWHEISGWTAIPCGKRKVAPPND